VKRATFAVAHSLIVIVFHILRGGVEFTDLGPTYFDERDRDRTTKRLTRRLEALGYHVALAQAE
jgi:hypothetical protein